MEGLPIMDALSNYEFYSTGVVDRPVPSTGRVEQFYENNVPNLWTYYCGAGAITAANFEKDVFNSFE